MDFLPTELSGNVEVCLLSHSLAELGRYFTNYVRKYIQDVHFDILVGFPGGSEGKELACNAGDLGSIPGVGRFPGEGNGYVATTVSWPGEFCGLYSIPVSWPREFHGLYSPWVCKESDVTE